MIFIQHSNDSFLKKDSPAWQLHLEIRPAEGETIIHKLKGNAFDGTNLHFILDQLDVNSLVITGLVTHGCVRATTLGALKLGYQVTLISDGHSNFSIDAEKLIKKWNQVLKEKGAELIPTRDLEF